MAEYSPMTRWERTVDNGMDLVCLVMIWPVVQVVKLCMLTWFAVCGLLSRDLNGG